MSNELPNQTEISGETPNDASALGKLNRPVFWVSSLIILAAILYTCIAGESAKSHFEALQAGIIKYAGWYYILTVAIIVLVTLFVCVSRYGSIRLGPNHSRPEYSYVSWFAMLFSAGMGIGLMFFGVAEPVQHFLNPPLGEGGTLEAAREAMNLTFFHWGIHAWAIYAVVALILAYFSFRHGLPLTLRSAFYPIIGDKINGPIGHAVDIFAVIGTLFGVATSLGFGVQQVNSGLHYLLDFIPENTTTQLILIVAVTALATLSVASGLDKGVKLLSQINLTLAVVLMAFLFLVGSSTGLLESFVQNLGTYLSTIVNKTFNLYAYNKTDWIGGWTIFYWGWWLSWSPFVGLFIAKISRGRTIREFIVGVLMVPTGFTFLWMTFFGNSAIDLILSGTDNSLGQIAKDNTPIALFEFLSNFPLANILNYVALLMVMVFFVTSADSGALVMDMLCSFGKTNRKLWYRIFWSVGAGAVAMVLLWYGGLDSLQTMAIATALPFVTVLMMAIWGFFKAIHVDDTQQLMQTSAVVMPPSGGGGKANWRERLKVVVHYPDQKTVEQFVTNQCYEACCEVAEEFRKNGINASAERNGSAQVSLTTSHGDEIDFVYSVIATPAQQPSFINDQEAGQDPGQYYRAEVHLAQGGLDYDVMGWSQEGLMNDIIEQYQKHLYFLNSIRTG